MISFSNGIIATDNIKPFGKTILKVFNFDNYYNHIRDFYDLMVEKGYMKKEAREKLCFTDSFEEMEKFIASYIPPKAREYHGE